MDCVPMEDINIKIELLNAATVPKPTELENKTIRYSGAFIMAAPKV